MIKRSLTDAEVAAYRARLDRWNPCPWCHAFCEAAWVFWCLGIVATVSWFFMNGWWKSGGWTLAIGLIGAGSFTCSTYILPPGIPEIKDE